MNTTIKIDDLTGDEIKQLLEEHMLGMSENTPVESRHALDLTALRQPDITFWSAWDESGDRGELLGCAALKEIDKEQAEVKSMRTAKNHLRKGVAKKLLLHIIAVAEDRAYKKMSLETGSQDSFEPAREFYQSLGFDYCPPFDCYVEDPSSVFMQLELT